VHVKVVVCCSCTSLHYFLILVLNVFLNNFCCTYIFLLSVVESAVEKHAGLLCVQLPLILPCYVGSGYGYTTHHVNTRLLRQFTIINIPTPADRSLHAIYSQVMQSTLDEFPPCRFDRCSELVEVVAPQMLTSIFIYAFILFYCT